MPTSFSDDRPRRPSKQQSHSVPGPDERRPHLHVTQRRDDLENVDEEIQRTQDELAERDDADSGPEADPVPVGSRTAAATETRATRRTAYRPAASTTERSPARNRRASSESATEGGTLLTRLGPKNWSRRQLARYSIIVGAIVLAVWLAPIIAGYTPLRNLVLSSLGKELNGTITASSAAFGWFSPVRLHDIEVRDDRGELVVKIPTVKTSRTLRQIIFDPANVGYIQLDRPQLRVVLEKGTSNVERVLSKILDSRDSSLSSPKLDVEVVGGSATIEDLDGRGRWQIDGLGSKLDLPRDWSGPMSLQVAGKVVQTRGGGQFDARLEMTKSRQADGLVDSTGSLKVTAAQFPLAMLQGALSRYEQSTQLAGWVSGEATYQWEEDTRDGRPVIVEANLAGEGVEVRGPAIGADTLHLEQLQVPCRITWQGEHLRIEKLAATCDVGQVSLSGALRVNLRKGVAAGLAHALRTNTYKVSGEVDLAALAKIMPGTLSVRRGTEIQQGRLRIELSRTEEKADRYGATGLLWEGKLASSSLRAISDGRPIVWDKPIQLQFTAHETPRGLHIQQLHCRSDFIEVTAQGEPSQLKVTAHYDLDRLAAKLNDFLDLTNAKLAGSGWSQIEWTRQDDGKIELSCESQLERFALQWSKRPIAAEERLSVRIYGTLEADPQTRRLQRVSSGTAIVTSGNDRLEVKLSAPVDFMAVQPADVAPTGFTTPTTYPAGFAAPSRGPAASASELAPRPTPPNLTGEAVWPLEVDLRGDLSRWRTRLQPWLNWPADWRLAGEAHLTANLDWSRSRIQLHKSDATIAGFRAALGPWNIEEREVRTTLSGRWEPPLGKGEIVQAVITGSAAAFDAHELSWTLPQRGNTFPTLQGEVTFNIDLDQVQRWSLGGASSTAKPAYQVTGVAMGKAQFKRNGQSATGQIDCQIDNLSIRAAGARDAWRDPRARLMADVRYDQLSDILHITKLDATTSTNTFSFRSQGKVLETSARRELDLRGDLVYSAQEVANVLFPIASKDVEIKAGRLAQPFYVKGVLGEIKQNDPFTRDPRLAELPAWARLTAGSQVDWTGANVYGFRFASGEIQAELRKGQVFFRPLDLSVNDGRLLANPRIDLVSSPPRLVLEPLPDRPVQPGQPFTLLDRVRITPEMCRRGLKYALPTLYGVADAQGQFSVRMKGCEIPLDDPFRGERAGEIVVHDVQIAPGPVLQAVATAIDAARLASGRKAEAAGQLRVARLKRESVVEYRMVDGKVYHRNLELDFDGLVIKTNGWVDLNQQINLVAKVSAPKLMARTPLAPASQSEISIPIAGTLDQPKIDRSKLGDALKALVAEEMLRGPTGELIRKGLEDTTKDVIRGLDTGLDRILPRRN